MHELNALFRPETVAVIGASRTPGKIGAIVVSNLVSAGFKGKIFPVNPAGGEIQGIPAVTDICDLPGPLDLAVVCVPPKAVLPSLEGLASVPVRAVIIITAGFREVGREGYFLEEQVVKLCREKNIILLGPNCLGLINTENGLNASFAAGQPPHGGIGFFSQSGALCVAILDWALGEGLGFSKFISLGNKAMLDESDMLEYLRQDAGTRVILGYMEGVEDGQAFMRQALFAARVKPVIMMKSGSTSAGARAASSHTGAMAGSDQAYQAAFHQSGVIRVADVETLFNLAMAFSSQPLPKGPNLAIVTNSGGPGILAADACERSRLMMAALRGQTVEQLSAFLPSFASLYNPIDIIGDADAERYEKTLEIVLQDSQVHAVMVLLTPTASAQVEDTARAVVRCAQKSGKPVFGCFMGEKTVASGREILKKGSIPCYAFPEAAIASIDAMYAYSLWREKSPSAEVCWLRDKYKAAKIFEQARGRDMHEVVEFEAQGVLAAYGLPIPETTLARTSDDAVAAAQKIGYPVVLKIASPQISHKSDVGGVAVNLATEEAVRRAFLNITSRAQRVKDAYVMGCLVQAMAPKGSKEVIVGFSRDSQFGPLILFGLGGIYVEILKDVSFRLAPLTLGDAHEMIREIRSFPLLRGVRGEPPVDFRAIEDIIMTMSQLALDFPDIYEADFNPVLVGEHGALIADCRFSLCRTDKC